MKRHAAWKHYRTHRHDVMNAVQVITGYLQLHRPETALNAAKQLADWLQSLSVLQTKLPESLETLLWAATACSRLRIQHEGPWTTLIGSEDLVGDGLVVLNDLCAELGMGAVPVNVFVDNAFVCWFRIEGSATEEIAQRWNNVWSAVPSTEQSPNEQGSVTLRVGAIQSSSAPTAVGKEDA